MKAILIGGGIGGSAAAILLKRAGIEVEIYEARSAVHAYDGYFLNVAGNGIEVLRQLGLEELEGSPVPRMIIWNGQGKRLGEVRNGARDGLNLSLIMRRGILQKSLHEQVSKAGIPLYFGKRLASIEDNCANFEDGTSAKGDFFIGSDGVHSRTRQLINPAAPKPSYTGLVSTGGFTRLLKLEPTSNTQHFFFGKRAFFGYHVWANGEIFWFNNFEQKTEPERATLEHISHEAWKTRLLDMHNDDLPLIQDIIRQTPAGISGYPIYDIPTQPLWYKNNVVLLGDAVHAISPSSGQGASLALEDAAVLAKTLCNTPNLESAFAQYQGLRRERVERMVKWARHLGQNKAAGNPLQIWLRDMMMPLFLKANATDAALDWIYAYQP
jgi:2-polyprenyl-6-methoxyphenol hydroxylase-like FAD-dependent oxidoreductase